ncbi:MAG: epoxyqueuosine reductase QueH, partial [Oscillospiraceae bacterium]
MKTLLHICCAPCSISCIEQLRGDGIEPVGFWLNPNIHPYTEYRQRKN